MTLSPPPHIEGHFHTKVLDLFQEALVNAPKSEPRLLKMTDEWISTAVRSLNSKAWHATRNGPTPCARTELGLGRRCANQRRLHLLPPLQVTSPRQGDAHPAVLRRYSTVLACAPGKTERRRFVHERESRLGYYMPRCRPLPRQKSQHFDRRGGKRCRPTIFFPVRVAAKKAHRPSVGRARARSTANNLCLFAKSKQEWVRYQQEAPTFVFSLSPYLDLPADSKVLLFLVTESWFFFSLSKCCGN